MAIIAIAESESDYSNFKRGLAITPGLLLRSCRSKLVMLLFFDKLQHAISGEKKNQPVQRPGLIRAGKYCCTGTV